MAKSVLNLDVEEIIKNIDNVEELVEFVKTFEEASNQEDAAIEAELSNNIKAQQAGTTSKSIFFEKWEQLEIFSCIENNYYNAVCKLNSLEDASQENPEEYAQQLKDTKNQVANLKSICLKFGTPANYILGGNWDLVDRKGALSQQMINVAEFFKNKLAVLTNNGETLKKGKESGKKTSKEI